MTFSEPWVPVEKLTPARPFSLAHIRWIRETEEKDDEGDSFITSEEMFDTVGEQYRLPSVTAAKQAITEAGAFLPPIFWLVPDNNNEHDANAVAVYAVVQRAAIHVGFLPRSGAVHFRESMASLGRPGETLEVRGCITQSNSNPHPNVRLNLPWLFADLVRGGFADDPANSPRWLSDATPVGKRPYVGPRAASFSDDELCKIYCWYGHQNGWFLLPDAVESQAQGFRASGLGSIHKVLQFFEEDIEDAIRAGREWATYNHNSEAKAVARAVIREHLSESMIEEDVKAEFKGTSVRGQLKDMGKQIYEIEWVRLGPPPELLCKMTLQKNGDSPDDYEVRAIEFLNQ
jgi:hypothetical protein